MSSEPRARCLIVTSNFPPVPGGSSEVYYNLAKWSGGRVAVLAAARDYRTGAPLPAEPAQVEAGGFSLDRLDLLRPLDRPAASLIGRLVSFVVFDLPIMVRLFRKIAEIVRRERVGVICIGELVYLGWLIVPCRYILGCRVIQYVHGEEITIRGGGCFSRLRKTYLRFPDAIVAGGNFTRDQLVELMKVAPGRIRVIQNGVDTTRFFPRPKRADLIQRYGLGARRVLLSVGRLVARTGVDKVLEALPQVLERHPDLAFLIVGQGPYRGALEATVRALSLADHVVFANAVPTDELADHYALADVFAQPSRAMDDGDTEGFGSVFLEANACGKPVIAGRAGGVADAVGHEDNGVVVDGTDARAVATGLCRLLEDPKLYERLQAGGLARARRGAWTERSRRFVELCDELLRGPPAGSQFQPSRAEIVEFADDEAPALMVVIDAEEEFRWGTFSTDATSVATIRYQERAQRIFDRFGVVPTYVVDYPVASQQEGYRYLRDFLRAGRCEVGAQLHPWVNPPFGEEVGEYLSYPGNLPRAMELEKLRRLTEVIELNLGVRPTVYRAGRYGAGPNTAEVLSELGYRIDCSVLPLGEPRPGYGPRFGQAVAKPYWFGPDHRLLEIPVTVGVTGLLSRYAEAVLPVIAHPALSGLYLPAVFARLRLLDRIRLTPEGISLDEAKRLTRTLVERRRQKVLALSYHSPSLEPGHTPYVRTEAELSTFLGWIEAYLEFFFGEIGGRATTPGAILARAEALRTRAVGPAPGTDARDEVRRTGNASS
jgi:glycosyltransferase involved in cell wall biosynthesis